MKTEQLLSMREGVLKGNVADSKKYGLFSVQDLSDFLG